MNTPLIVRNKNTKSTGKNDFAGRKLVALFMPIFLLAAIAVSMETRSFNRLSELSRAETNGIELARSIHEILAVGYVMSQQDAQDAASWQSSFRRHVSSFRKTKNLLCAGGLPERLAYEPACTGELGLERSFERFMTSGDNIGRLDPTNPAKIRRYLSHLFIGTNGNLLPSIDVVTQRLHEERVKMTTENRERTLIGGFVLIVIAAFWTFLAVRSLRAELRKAMRDSESARLKAEAANDAKSNFLANMSHEMRTPLNAIMGFSQVIEGEVVGSLKDYPTTYRNYAGDISSSAAHLLKLITDVLDVAKAEAGKLEIVREPFQLRSVVNDVLRMLHPQLAEKKILLRTEMDFEYELNADSRLIAQALINLISNSIKFTPEAGAITVAAQPLVDGGICISVEDTGIGIEEEHLPRVFESFYQVEAVFARHAGGTGLGLSIVNLIAQGHDGVLNIRSVPGNGTTVGLSLPRGCVIAKKAIAPQVDAA